MTDERLVPVDAPATMRGRLMAAAVDVLRERGPSEMKARVIAEAVDASTVAIYHHFGGMPELLSAVVTNGFSDLMERFRATDALIRDPTAQLFALALTTRDMAQSNTHLYDLMFALSTRGTYRTVVTRPEAPVARFEACYTQLVAVCQRLNDTKRLAPITADEIAAELWSAVHGFVTMEAAGHFAAHSEPVSAILLPLATRIMLGMGEHPDLVAHGAQIATDWWHASPTLLRR